MAEAADVYQGLGWSGRRAGEWGLRLVESSDLPEGGGWLDHGGLREIEVDHNVRTERHLLQSFGVLVAAWADRPGLRSCRRGCPERWRG